MTQLITLTNGRATLVSDEDFHWLSQRKWHLNGRGYVTCSLWGKRGGTEVYMHRLILLAPDTATVDHINHDPLDNRRTNLRLATQSQQNANKPKFKGKSRFKGVYRRWDGRKWVAQIKHGKPINLGSFESEIAAALAYNKAAIEHFGEFAHLNEIPSTEFCHEGKPE